MRARRLLSVWCALQRKRPVDMTRDMWLRLYRAMGVDLAHADPADALLVHQAMIEWPHDPTAWHECKWGGCAHHEPVMVTKEGERYGSILSHGVPASGPGGRTPIKAVW